MPDDATAVAQPERRAGDVDLVSDGLMTVAQAAEFLALGPRTLYSAMECGQLVYCKLGRARRIPKRALLAYAAANMQGGWAVDPQIQGLMVNPKANPQQ